MGQGEQRNLIQSSRDLEFTVILGRDYLIYHGVEEV